MKHRKFTKEELTCEFCGDVSKTPAGKSAHIRFNHPEHFTSKRREKALKAAGMVSNLQGMTMPVSASMPIQATVPATPVIAPFKVCPYCEVKLPVPVEGEKPFTFCPYCASRYR